MKTAELTGAALDWAVAKCEGLHWEEGDLYAGKYGPGFAPATDWTDAGPIIERERIELRGDGDEGWIAYDNLNLEQYGDTPLIAAMRCYVASMLGDEVDVPEELT